MSIAFHPRVWLNFMIPPLYRIEREILSVAINAEHADYRRQIESQIRAINFVQRHANGREVYFFRVEGGVVRASLGVPINLPQREFLWAKVRIRSGNDVSLAGQIWFLNGWVGNLTFDRAVNHRKLERGTSVELLSLNSVRVAETIQQDFIGQLPSDLNELATTTEAGVGNVVFIRPDTTYEVTLPEGNFVVIGEVVDRGAILFPSVANRAFSGVYFGPYDGSSIRYLGVDCLSALRALERIASGNS